MKRSAASPSFALRIPILFSDVDPAGSAYYPRLVDFCHRAFETFFNERLKTPYARVIASGVGFPTVRFEAEFESPLRHGDTIALAVSVRKVGRTSLTLDYVARRGRTIAFRASNVVVCVDLATGRPKPLASPLRRRLS